MRADQVAVAPECAECGARWLPADPKRWRAYLSCDKDLDEVAELVILCTRCADREFGGETLERADEGRRLGRER